MFGAIKRYVSWLHTRWPAAHVEPLPEVAPDGSTRVPGLFVAGDLAGVPLLKFALDSGARVVERIAADPSLRAAPAAPGTPDLAIVGAGVAGMAAALEARRRGLSLVVLEAAEAFFTIANFPAGKPIFTYPAGMTPAGTMRVTARVKEELLAELRAQAAHGGIVPLRARAHRVERRGGLLLVHVEGGAPVVARRVIVAIGRSGDFRRLGVPGEDLPFVVNRLHDPGAHAGRRTLVVGGGDSAVEAALALAEAGARVTLVHRGDDLVRPRPALREALRRAEAEGRLEVRRATRVRAFEPGVAHLEGPRGAERAPADAVYVLIGRTAPLDLLRRSGVPIAGEWTRARGAAFAGFLLFCAWLYDWKSGGAFAALWQARGWFPFNVPDLLSAAGGALAAAAADPATLVGTLAISAAGPAFWYTLAYSALVVGFGVRRVRARRTPYVTAQTATLALVQVLPLFLLPEVLLPLLDHNGALPRPLADALFPEAAYGHGREFWRAYGLILAFPLNVYNLFTPEPLPWWIAISVVQTCVLIPLAVLRYGKGAYCGWICSCGALAETLGDRHRHRMPHGPGWNRLNLAGQAILALALAGLALRVAGWLLPDGNWADRAFFPLVATPYKWAVDVFLAGVVGYGVYFWFSGRVWCRFFCPLAAFMHVFARLGRFRIFADKEKCISCGQCTQVCHQGIHVMAFAQRGLPMADPQCVRCSACVWTCPTGVLAFGRAGRDGRPAALDALAASPVRMREGT
uniref:FAD-binding protein n=1 Tax=Eiseniibacteriota bacterium TaxID=2212470 RepID=A0A832HZS1_UNCEI